MIHAILYASLAVLLIAFLIKNAMTCGIRIRCVSIDVECCLAGPSYERMLFNPFRWTFAQHYPELAKRVKP